MNTVSGKPASDTPLNRSRAADSQECSLLIRGAVVIADTRNPDTAIMDGAVCVRDDRIIAVGAYEELIKNFEPKRIYGSKNQVVIPGLVNAHDHVRAPSTVQSGVPDDVLEAWLLDLLRLPSVDPQIASTLACCQLLESGVTTVLNSFYEPSPKRYRSTLSDTITGCERSGIRTVFCLSVMDRSITATLLERLAPELPGDLRSWAHDFVGSRSLIGASDYFDVVHDWHNQIQSTRSHVMMGPVSVHWCSDQLIQRIWEEAELMEISIQTHLLESGYQRHESEARYGKSIVEHMSDLGLLSARLSCAHCVHVNADDIGRLASSDVSVIHNAGSNMRLRSGISPVRAMLQKGINVGLGLDSLAVNDDGDMLREMGFVALSHRSQVEEFAPLLATQVLQMATAGGARALGMLDSIGSLEIGKKADVVVLNLESIPPASGQSIESLIDELVTHGNSSCVDTVIVDGELVVLGGRHVGVDKQSLLEEMSENAKRNTNDLSASNAKIKGLKPYLHRHLEIYNA